MGVFSFFKSDKPNFSDKVWKSTEYALKGMITDALQMITRNEMPIALSFFDDTSQQIKEFLNAKQVPYFVLDSSNMQEAATQSNVIFILGAGIVYSSSQLVTFLLDQSKKQKVNFLFFGHYPISTRENKILDKIKPLINSSTTFYSSLDDGAFKIFGADLIKTTLEKLGLADEEAIEHDMVSRSMKNAREKIEENVKHEIVCSTEKEWYHKNYKDKES